MAHVLLLSALLPPRHHAQPLPALYLPCEKGITVTSCDPPTTLESTNKPSTEPKTVHMYVLGRTKALPWALVVLLLQGPCHGSGWANSQLQPQGNTCI